MSIREEFEKLVKEANNKLDRQNRKKEAEESQTIENLQRRQEMLINILSKSNVSNSLSQGLQE